MKNRYQHGTWRRERWSGRFTVTLLALVVLSGCGVPDRASQSPFPTAGAAGEVVLTFLDPNGYPSGGNAVFMLCIGAENSFEPTVVPGRIDAMQVVVTADFMQEHSGDPIGFRQPLGSGMAAFNTVCANPGAGQYDRVDPAQTTYIRTINTLAWITEDLQQVHDAVDNPATRATIAAAISHLVASDVPGRWTDQRHLNPATGDQVFTDMIAAVDLLTPLIPPYGVGVANHANAAQPIDEHAPPPTPGPTALPYSNDEAALDRIRYLTSELARLAQNTVAVLAFDAEVGPAALAPATTQIRTDSAAATQELLSGNYSAAITGYRAAWNTGIVALGQQP